MIAVFLTPLIIVLAGGVETPAAAWSSMASSQLALPKEIKPLAPAAPSAAGNKAKPKRKVK